jgi:predicted nucleic acid-binding protein
VIVLDTSAAVEFLVGSDDLAEDVRVAVSGQKLAAPHAVDLECASTLRGLVQGRSFRLVKQSEPCGCSRAWP